MGLSINCLCIHIAGCIDTLSISVHLIQSSSLVIVMFWLYSIHFYFKLLCSLSLDSNTVHLAFRYSFSMVHLFMVHLGLLQGFKSLPVFQQLLCCQLIVQCSLSLLITWLHVLSHLCYTFVCSIIHRYIITSPIIQCITLLYYTSINYFSTHIFPFFYNIQYTASVHIASFHTYFHVLPNLRCQWALCIYLFVS